MINGGKLWITNGTVADVAVIWANTSDEPGGRGIRGFVVPTDTPGFAAHAIHHKLSLRASVTAELTLDEVRVPSDAAFPEVTGLKGPLSCLSEARYGIVWGCLGAARTALEVARRYSIERTETTRPTMARAKMTRPAKTPRKKLRTPHDRMPGPPAKAPRDDEIRQRKAGIPVSACPITRVCISTVPS